MITLSLVTVLGAAAGCGKSAEEEAKKMAEEQAAKNAEARRSENAAQTYKIEVPVMGGHRIDCLDLFPDIKPFEEGISAASGEKVELVLHQLDRKVQIKRQPGVNAVCEFLRAGTPLTPEEQKKMSEKTARLGVQPGDRWCEIRVDCGKPFDENWESNCRKMLNHEGHRDLGVFSCVMKSMRAERDAFRYKLFEPDTKCYLDILGGDSVTDDPVPRACAKAAIDEMNADSIAKYKNLGPTPADLVEAQQDKDKPAP